MNLTARLRREWAANRGWTTEVQAFFSVPATRSRRRRARVPPTASHLHAGMTGHLLHVLGAGSIPRARGDFRAARRGTAPGLREHEIAGFYFFGARGRGEKTGKHGRARDCACD